MGTQAPRAGSDVVLSDAIIWALESLCRLHRIPFDAELVLKQFPPPYDLASLLRAAQACGLKAGFAGARARALASLPLPCLGFVRAGAEPANDPSAEPPASTPALLVPHRALGEAGQDQQEHRAPFLFLIATGKSVGLLATQRQSQ